MSNVIDNGYFTSYPGLVLCVACRHTHAAMVQGFAPVNALECDHCHEQDSIFISAAAIKKVLGLVEDE